MGVFFFVFFKVCQCLFLFTWASFFGLCVDGFKNDCLLLFLIGQSWVCWFLSQEEFSHRSCVFCREKFAFFLQEISVFGAPKPFTGRSIPIAMWNNLKKYFCWVCLNTYFLPGKTYNTFAVHIQKKKQLCMVDGFPYFCCLQGICLKKHVCYLLLGIFKNIVYTFAYICWVFLIQKPVLIFLECATHPKRYSCGSKPVYPRVEHSKKTRLHTLRRMVSWSPPPKKKKKQPQKKRSTPRHSPCFPRPPRRWLFVQGSEPSIDDLQLGCATSSGKDLIGTWGERQTKPGGFLLGRKKTWLSDFVIIVCCVLIGFSNSMFFSLCVLCFWFQQIQALQTKNGGTTKELKVPTAAESVVWWREALFGGGKTYEWRFVFLKSHWL